MKIGVQTGDVIKDFGIEEGYRMIKAAGFECLDFNLDHALDAKTLGSGTYKGHSVIEGGVGAVIAQYAAELDTIRRNGLEITQMHAPFPSYVSGKPETLDYMIEIYKTSIEFCNVIGVKNLVIHGISLHVDDKIDTQDAVDELNMKLYTSLIPTLRACNVTVCLENLFSWYTDKKGYKTLYSGHCANPYEAVAEIDMLNEVAGKECFGLCLDTGHLNLMKIPFKKYVQILGRRIKCLHVHDNDGTTDQHLAPYTGSVRWDDFCEALAEIGYDGDLSFETYKQTSVNTIDSDLVSPWLDLIAATGRVFRNKIIK